VARDTASLDERNRLMETLSTLLDAVNKASHEERGAIDALIESTASVLDRVGTQFTDKAAAETDKLAAVAAQVTGSAVEVASLGDAFGVAVQLFSQSSDKLMEQLRRVEASLTQSISRSDEQLAYYVAQARELIDLSVMSQKQIIDDLQQLATSRRAIASEAA
jgi:ABC-type transporter Mla subunit MlaD